MPVSPDDVNPDSSQELDAPASITSPNTTSTTASEEVVVEDKSKQPSLIDEAIKKLANVDNKDTADTKKESRQPDQKDDAKPDAKPNDKKESESPLNEEEKRTYGRKAQERIIGLHKQMKETENKLKTIESSPSYQVGTWFDNIIKDNNLTTDASTVQDDEIAGAIQFQGTLNRVQSGHGTDRDKQVLARYFDTFAQTAESLGFSKQSTSDTSHISGGIKQALETLSDDLDVAAFVSKVTELLESKPESKKQVQRKAPEAAPQTRADDSDGVYYSTKLVRDASFMEESKNPQQLYDSLVLRSLESIRKMQPGINPRQYYNSLSSRAKYELLSDELQAIKIERDQQKVTKLPPASGGNPIRDTSAHAVPRKFNSQIDAAIHALSEGRSSY